MQVRSIAKNCILALKGILVGFGAIMPGISGGTLCVAFGMYDYIIGLLSRPRETLKKHWAKLLIFILGAGLGFIGLSGLAGALLEANGKLVTCVFIGFVIGTMPSLWHSAGKKGRGSPSYVSMAVSFVIMLAVLIFLRNANGIEVSPNMLSFFFSGIVWGLSFIVPGLSSSTLLLFFGLYEPMLTGISRLALSVVIPLGLGFGLCMLLLPRAVNALYKSKYAEASHAIIGVVVASMIMIFPVDAVSSLSGVASVVACILGGAIVSYCLDKLCSRL